MEQVFSEESDEGGGADETAPPKPTRGPDIEFPLQRKDIDLLIEAFRKKKVHDYSKTFPFAMNGSRALPLVLTLLMPYLPEIIRSMQCRKVHFFY